MNLNQSISGSEIKTVENVSKLDTSESEMVSLTKESLRSTDSKFLILVGETNVRANKEPCEIQFTSFGMLLPPIFFLKVDVDAMVLTVAARSPPVSYISTAYWKD